MNLNIFESVLLFLRIDPFTDFLVTFITHQIYIAPFILLLIEEAGVPLPIPGDIYIALVGYQVSLGRFSYVQAFILLILSVLIGSSILYYISAKWGNKIVIKLGKYIHVEEKSINYVEVKFRKYGIWVIIIGRHIPGFRIPLTIFSGISGISYKTFITCNFISIVFWIAFYLSVGQRVGKRVMHLLHIHPYYYLFLLIPVFLFILYTIRNNLLKVKKN